MAMAFGARGHVGDSPPLPLHLLQSLTRTLDSDWQRFGSRDYSVLRRALRDFERTSTVATIAGLLTEPECHVATLRLEMLQHIAVSACRGTRQVTVADLRLWLEDILGSLPIRNKEDPVEDVFISNVIAPGGNYRLFEGIWELNDASLQPMLDALVRSPWATMLPSVGPAVLALLRVSEAVAERAAVPRWAVPHRIYPATECLPAELDMEALRSRVCFTWDDLSALGIDATELEQFEMQDAMLGRLRNDSLQHSSLERRPLLATDDGLILTCPAAVSPAIRRYVLEACEDAGVTETLARAIRWVHSKALFAVALPRLNDTKLLPRKVTPPVIAPPTEPLDWDEAVGTIDVDKACVVVLLPDALVDAARTGLVDPPSDRERGERLSRHLRDTTKMLAESATGGGLVVIVHGGVGRGQVIGIPTLPAHWHTFVMSSGDFEMFANSPDASLLRLWKLEEQRDRLATAGIHVPDTNGAVNTYAYWSQHNFTLCPDEMPYPAPPGGTLAVGTEFVHSFRIQERRHHDVHAVAVGGATAGMVRVRRLARAAFFPAMHERPLFVSEEAAASGDLVGVFEVPALIVWVVASKPKRVAEATRFIYQLWEAVVSWLDRLVPELIRAVARDTTSATVPPPQQVIQVRLELTDDDAWHGLADLRDPIAARPHHDEGPAPHQIVISIPFGFVTLLRQPKNDGERALLEVLSEALLNATMPEGKNPRGTSTRHRRIVKKARVAVARAMRSTDARHVHLFQAEHPTDVIAAAQGSEVPSPRFIFDEDLATWTNGLAWHAFDRKSSAGSGEPASTDAEAESGDTRGMQVVVGLEACTGGINKVVAAIWEDLRGDLLELNGPSLVALALANLDAVARDREQWSRTARALLALFGHADDVASISSEREGRRTIAGIAGRTLVEMAVCTCPNLAGREAALTDLDHLTAGITALLGLAFDSDAIHGGLAEPRVVVQPNGSLTADRTYQRDIVTPFSTEVHATDFHAAVAAYSRLYNRRSENEGSGATSAFDSEFTTAFTAEFAIPPDRVIDGFAELLDLGVETNALVVSTTRGVIAGRLAQQRSFTAAEVTAFLRLLALVPRPRWNQAPRGFTSRDWTPWRFRRRLSLAARPLVAFGPLSDDATPVMYGMHQLGASVSYLFDNLRAAWLPLTFFTSESMKAYWGNVAHAKGAAFTQTVADNMTALGWRVSTEVQMASIGAPVELGDLDVVAWRDGDDRVLLIECKRLQPARTVGEIADLLREFKGEGKDRLGRHMDRVAWVGAQIAALSSRLGFVAAGRHVVPALVTNRQVPMAYKAGLPLSPDQIIPLASLATRIER